MDSDILALLRRAYGLGDTPVGSPQPVAPPAQGATPNQAPPIEVPPDDPGILHTIGTILDIPGNAIRSLLAGNPSAAIHPFAQHTSGQDLIHQWFGVEKSPDLFSAPGGAGLATELLLDPLTYLGGLGALNKAGKAVKLVGGHLGEIENAAKVALGKLPEAERAAATVAHGSLPFNIIEGGKALSDSELVQKLAEHTTGPLQEAAKSVIENNLPARLPVTRGERIRSGLADMLRTSDEIDPFGLLRLPLALVPGAAKALPKIPLLTAPLHLPFAEQRILGGAPIADAVGAVTGKIGDLLSPLTNLFKAVPGAGQEANEAAAQSMRQRATEYYSQAEQAQQEGQKIAAASAGLEPDIGAEARAFQEETAAHGRLLSQQKDLQEELARMDSPEYTVNPFGVDHPDRAIASIGPEGVGLMARNADGSIRWGDIQKSLALRKETQARVAEAVSAKLLQAEIERQSARMAEETQATEPAFSKAYDANRMGEIADARNAAVRQQIAQMDAEAAGRQDAATIYQDLSRQQRGARDTLRTISETLGEPPPARDIRQPIQVTELPTAPRPVVPPLPQENLEQQLLRQYGVGQGQGSALSQANNIARTALNPAALVDVGEAAVRSGNIVSPTPETLPQTPVTLPKATPEQLAQPTELELSGALGKPAAEPEPSEEFLSKLFGEDIGGPQPLIGPSRLGDPNYRLPPEQSTRGISQEPDLYRELLGQRLRQPIRSQLPQSIQAAAPKLSPFDELASRFGDALKKGAALPEMSPEAQRAVADAVEHGKTDIGPLAPVAEHIAEQNRQWLELEQAFGAPTKPLQTERNLNYYFHGLTTEGAQTAKRWSKDPSAFTRDMLKLAAVAKSKGVDIDHLLNMSVQEQRAERDLAAAGIKGPLTNTATGVNSASIKTWISRQGPQEQALLNSNPMLSKALYESFKSVGLLHGAQIPRMPLLSWGGINEINDALGKKFFETNPAVIQTQRGIYHARVSSAIHSAEDLALQRGRELTGEGVTFQPEAAGAAAAPTKLLVAEGVSLWHTPEGQAFGVDAVNKWRESQKLPPIVLDNLAEAKAMAKGIQSFVYPEQTDQLLKWYDGITYTFKNLLTRGWPAFHARNLGSNMIQSYFGDVPLNAPSDYKIMPALAGKDVSFQFPTGTMSRDQLIDAAKKMGVLRGGFFENLMRETLARENQNPMRALYNKALGGMEQAASTIAAAPIALSSGAPEVLKNMSGRMIEDYSRLRHFVYKLEQGASLSAAAEDVNKYLFDYSKTSMSDFEKNVMNRLVFFYGYNRNVLPLMANTVLDNLGKISQVTRLGIQPGLPERIPEYARGDLILPRGQDEAGNPKLTYDLSTPVEAAVGALGTNPLTELNPIPRTALELLGGRDFFLHKNIEDARTAPHYAKLLPDSIQNALGVTSTPMSNGQERVEMNPYIAYALRNNPLSRVSNTISRFTDERKPFSDALLNFVAGPRTISVDEEQEQKRAVKDAIKAQLDKEIGLGGAYKFQEYAPTKTEEGQKTKALLKLLRLESR